jgi:CO/xanthine dehydrogenase Mo-binding subunit
VVAAFSEDIAEQALARIKVEYRVLPTVFDALSALAEDAPRLYDEGNLAATRRITRGDVEKGLQAADVVIENTYTTTFNEHAALEPEAGLAYVDDAGRVVIYTCTQCPHDAQRQVARILDRSPEEVRVIQTPTGGGFGGKLDISVQGVLGLLASKLKRPVRLVYSRQESFLATAKRHPFRIRHRLGATREGRLTALQVELLANTGAYAAAGPFVLTRAAIHAGGPYEIPNVLIEGKMVFTNNPFCAAMRGFGVPQVTFAMESQMDILASELGIDPLELRRINAYDSGSVTPTGQALGETVPFKETLQAVEKFYLSSLKEREAEARRAVPRGLKRGVGVASMWYSIGKTSVTNQAEAWVELLSSGRLHVLSGAADIGQGCSTALAQIAAQELGVPLEAVDITLGDTALTPDANLTCASRQTYYSGNAIQRAAAKLKQAILKVACQVLEVEREDIVFRDGYICSISEPTRRIDLSEMASFFQSQGLPLRYKGSYDFVGTDLDPETGEGIPYATYTYGTQMAEVEVNEVTGEVKVLRVIAAHDVGKAIHPLGVQGQMEGGITMGLGFALKEEFVPGETGGFTEYRIPTALDTPEIVTWIIEIPEPTGPFGAKGAGEQTLVPTAPAILNAIADATGVRIFGLPATADRVLAAFGKMQSSNSERSS